MLKEFLRALNNKEIHVKTVLITGAAGFVASHLCDRFLQEGYKVVGLDNFITGRPNNIEHLFKNQNFHFLKYDVTQYLYYAGDIDLILHFACPASPIDYLKYPIQTMKVNSIGTFHTLGLALLKKARFLFASTSEIYGQPEIHPQTEEYWGNVNPVGPRSVYDEAKRFSEALTMAYHHTNGLDVRMCRIFNTYGPRMRIDDGRAIPTFVAQALQNQPISIFGEGDQTRSFCYVTDLVEGIFRLATMENLNGKILNLGNPDEYTIKELADMVISLTDSKSTLEYHPLPKDDPTRRKPDIQKAKEVLNWSPGIEFREGLQKTIDYLAKELKEQKTKASA